MAEDLFERAMRLRRARRPHVIATVTETQGSTSAKPGSKTLIDETGRLLCGWIGGGCAEAMVRENALECLNKGEVRVIEVLMEDEAEGTGMPCGGRMKVLIEPWRPAPTLWLLGHGRLVDCLARLGLMMGFDVTVHDPAADEVPEGTRLITDDLDYRRLTPAPADFVVIATQHKGDYRSLQRALKTEARYVALIASRYRARLVRRALVDEGLPAKSLRRLRSPAGLDLGAATPEEIALSVMAEITACRRGGTARMLSDASEV